MSRIVVGAMAGICATMVMTIVMKRGFELLPKDQRYPLPPAEIASGLGTPKGRLPDRALLLHVAFGSVAGAVYAGFPVKIAGGAYGAAVWAASYLGWLPALGLLRAATRHPVRRNLLMLAAHVIWGSALSRLTVELETAQATALADGNMLDQPRGRGLS
nr:hypothetical protein REQ54_04331 [Rhizobium sp. Q54]